MELLFRFSVLEYNGPCSRCARDEGFSSLRKGWFHCPTSPRSITSGRTGSWCRGRRRRRMSCPHSLHYGSGVFEGIRCYKSARRATRAYVFRLRDHMERLHRSCKIAQIELPYSGRRADATPRWRSSVPTGLPAVLHPPIGVPRLRRHGRRSRPGRPRTWSSPCGRGMPTWAPTRWKTAWPWACPRGVSARTTPSRPR